MREFKDSAGGVWEIRLQFGDVTRIKKASEGKFNLLEPDSLSDKMLSDFAEFYELLWYLVEPQAKTRGIDAEQFGQLLAADCIHTAQDKFFREWADFFRGLQRADVATALELMVDEKLKAMKTFHERLLTEVAVVSETMDKKTSQVLNKEFGKLRDSLASILET